MEYLLGIAVVVIVYLVVKTYLRKTQTAPESKQAVAYQYAAKNNLMTPSESEFFKMLVEVAGDRYYVFPQVHLSALLNGTAAGQYGKSAFRHINQKSVDYVLCDIVTLKPTYAVELDDHTHERASRQERDREVERIFAGAAIPLIRFSNYRNLTVEDISQRFYEAHVARSAR